MNLAKAMVTVAGLTGVSRVLGFIRDVLTAAILGAGPIGDAFFVALKLPNFFRRVTAEGAFSVSFVPLYSEALEQDGQDEANLFASNAFMVMLTALSVFTVIALIFMPYIIYAVAPGFIGDEVRYDLAVELSRVTFPYLLMMSLTALLGGVLNALGRFAPFAFAPVIFNLCLISALLLVGHFENAGFALAWGIFAAGVLQLIWLWQCAKRAGVRIKLARPRMSIRVKKVFKLMGPGVIGAGVMHINLFADLIIASFLTTGSISYLYYADRLNQLPLGIIGIAVGTALLPMLSKAVAAGKTAEANSLFNRALEYCFLFGLPASLALMVFAGPLVTGLFERGAFEASDSLTTSYVLMGYCIGLVAYIATKVFSTVHWAHQDTTTPVKIAVVGTVFNIALSLVLIQFIGVTGIAVATGLSGWLQFAMHLKALKRKEGFFFDARFKRAFVKILIASVVMVAVTNGVARFVDDVIDLGAILDVVVIVGTGITIYGLCALRLGLIKFSDLKGYLKR